MAFEDDVFLDGGPRDSGIEIVAGFPDQARLLPQRGYCAVHVAAPRARRSCPLTEPAARPDSRVCIRHVVDHGLLVDEEFRRTLRRCARRGDLVRVHHAPPLRFTLTDQAEAVVGLAESGAAVVFRTPAMCGMFAWAFERLWAEAEEYPAGRPGKPDLDPLHVRILRMLADNENDTAIAAAIGISDRSLRRHIATMLQRLAVHSKPAAVAEAFRMGILSCAPHEPINFGRGRNRSQQSISPA